MATTQTTISVVFCLTPQAIGTLEEVAMTQNTINTISVVFCLTPQAIGTLEELSMPQNGINLPGITALVEAIAVNTKLKVLNLNDNTFTDAGGREMAKVCLLSLSWWGTGVGGRREKWC